MLECWCFYELGLDFFQVHINTVLIMYDLLYDELLSLIVNVMGILGGIHLVKFGKQGE